MMMISATLKMKTMKNANLMNRKIRRNRTTTMKRMMKKKKTTKRRRMTRKK